MRALAEEGSASTNCWPRTTSASPCDVTTCRRSPTAPPPWCWPRRPARQLVERPAYITGFDHRTECHNPSFRALDDSPSTRIAAEAAGLGDEPVEVAELQAALHPRGAAAAPVLGLGDDVTVVNPSGGASRQSDHGHRSRAHRRRRRPHLRRWQPGPGPRHIGPVPATEPHLHPGGPMVMSLIPVRGRRRRSDPSQVPPPRRLVGGLVREAVFRALEDAQHDDGPTSTPSSSARPPTSSRAS